MSKKCLVNLKLTESIDEKKNKGELLINYLKIWNEWQNNEKT